MDEEYMNIKGLADRIGFCPDPVYEWIAPRGLPARRNGKRGRITVVWSEFLQWWERNS